VHIGVRNIIGLLFNGFIVDDPEMTMTDAFVGARVIYSFNGILRRSGAKSLFNISRYPD
jgi:hypothetical protein